MERLTERDGEFIKWKGCPLYEMGPAEIYTMAERLAAYEDSELSPEGCAQAAEANRLMEAFGLPVERIVELLKAEIHGRRITLPCVPGDTLWLSQMFYTQPKEPIPAVVHAIRFDADGIMIVTGKRRFAAEAIGKTVFYTREEAEKAMRRYENGADDKA